MTVTTKKAETSFQKRSTNLNTTKLYECIPNNVEEKNKNKRNNILIVDGFGNSLKDVFKKKQKKQQYSRLTYPFGMKLKNINN